MRMNTRLDAPVHNRYRVACSSFKGYLGASFTCIKDDVPMDPFAGSGSTLVAAKCMERNAIGIECMQDFCDTARERLKNIP